MPEKVFYRRNRMKAPAFDIGTILRRTATAGEIGIEIEVEGNKFKKTHIPSPWGYVKDGSLRGQDNAEYVLLSPIMFDQVPEAIDTLWKMFKDYGSKLDESNRTSVHVHLNAQRFHLNRLCSFFALYFVVEEILTEWCGDHRIGNLFCLRAKDAPNIISTLKKFLQSDGQTPIPNGMHYSGMNAQALFKFGSIEIRSLQGVTDPNVILDWVSILERIYKMSAEYPDPRNICDNFSGEGPLNFLAMILGDKYDTVKNNIDFDTQRVMESMYDGIRLAQDLCYCRDWSEYKPTDVKKDPFGRAKEKSMETLYSQFVDQISPLNTLSQASQYISGIASQPISIQNLWAPTHGTVSEEEPDADDEDFEGPEWFSEDMEI